MGEKKETAKKERENKSEKEERSERGEKEERSERREKVSYFLCFSAQHPSNIHLFLMNCWFFVAVFYVSLCCL